MATFTPAVSEPPVASRRRGHNQPPFEGSGDGDRDNPGSPDYASRLRRARLGLGVALTPILMLFVSFTSAYVVRQGLPTLDPETNKVVHDWVSVPLPTALFLINTLVLIASSLTIERARRQLSRQMILQPIEQIPGVRASNEKRFPWLGITILLGLAFLTGQWFAWRELADRGFFVATGPSSSFFYLLTGAHAFHLMGGILALFIAGSTVILRRSLESRQIAVDVTAWYWHFMALLWIYILALLEFAH